jgi:hypothetical protein
MASCNVRVHWGERIRSVCRKTLKVLVSFFLSCLLITGCGTTKKIAGKITADIIGKGSNLKKKVGFLPTANRSHYGSNVFGEMATAQLKTFLGRNCDDLFLLDSTEIRKALEGMARLQSGQIDNMALAERGRLLGLGAIMEQTISGVQFVTEKRGLWGLRENVFLMEVSSRLRVYDTETTATLLDEVFREELEFQEGKWRELRITGKYDQETSNLLLFRIVSKIGEQVCERLAEVPWKGYIISGEGDTYTLSAGSDVGLTSGDTLEVFGIGDPIKGLGEQVYLVSGPKIGEIKITNVNKRQAKAVSISGGDLEKSSCVKLKQ